MAIKKVGVVGTGIMGHAITQVVAQAGYDVVTCDRNQEKLDKGLAKIDKQLAKAVDKGKLEQSDADAAKGRITGTLDKSDFSDCDIAIEAVTEDLETKQTVWKELDEACGNGTIFASNTSSLAVVDMAAATKRPDKFIGLHFFNPAQIMPLLEVVKSITTSDETYEAGYEFGKSLGKKCVRAKDKTGFIVNRLLVPYMLDAIRALEEGAGTIEEIDIAMQAGANHPMGPFTLLDFVGLDTTKSIADIMFDEFRERRFAAPPTLRKMVSAGYYGRKSGKGFYDYSGEKPVPSNL